MHVNVRGDQSIGATLLFIAFLVLKLTHVIAWSWWWVTAPIWIPVALVVLVVATIFAVAFVKR